jgi:uncharacterized phage protein (TIGR01671 family)
MKYRIWDKVNNKYLPKHTRYYVSQDSEVIVEDRGGFATNINQDNYTVELSTGLLDKNGVEIYQNDNVNLHFFEPFDNECVTIDDECTVKGYVTYDIGGWFVQEEDSTWYYLGTISDNAHIEITGNIHDTPRED